MGGASNSSDAGLNTQAKNLSAVMNLISTTARMQRVIVVTWTAIQAVAMPMMVVTCLVDGLVAHASLLALRRRHMSPRLQRWTSKWRHVKEPALYCTDGSIAAPSSLYRTRAACGRGSDLPAGGPRARRECGHAGRAANVAASEQVVVVVAQAPQNSRTVVRWCRHREHGNQGSAAYLLLGMIGCGFSQPGSRQCGEACSHQLERSARSMSGSFCRA